MMRRSWILPLACLSATPALAQGSAPVTQQLQILGTSPSACVMNGPSVTSAVNASFSAQGLTSGEILITQFVDPQTANPVASSVDLSLPVICNTAHSLTVRSGNGGLLRDGGSAANRRGPSNFGDFVDYNLSLSWSGQHLSGASSAGNLQLNTPNAAAGDVTLQITTPAGGGVLTAGHYSDTVVIEFRATS